MLRRVSWPAPSFFRRRALMCGALGLSAGIALARPMPYAPWMWAIPAALLLLGGLLRRFRRVFAALLLLGCVALGIARGGMELTVPALPKAGRWVAEGTVDGPVNKSEKAVMFFLRDVRVQGDDGGWTDIDTKLYCYYATTSASSLFHGQRVTVQGTAYLAQSARNPGGFDQKTWLAQNGAHARMYLNAAPKRTAQAGFSLRGTALSISESLGQRIDAVFGGASSVVRAMVIGESKEVPDEWYAWMSDSGIVHLLSVSGLHVGLWFVLLSFLLRPVPVSPRVRWVLLAVLLAAYALITGLRASVLRAAIMLLAVQGGQVAKRKVDPLTSISLAAGLILLFRPLDLFAAGFQLSFTAVLGIVLLRPTLKRALGLKPEAIADTFYTTLSAQLGILPASSFWFGRVSLIGLVSNLIAVPIAGFIIPVAVGTLLLDAVWTPLGWLLVHSARGLVAALLVIAKFSAAVPFAIARVGAFSPWAMAAYFCCMLLCSSATIWRWRTRLAAMGVSLCVVVSAGVLRGDFAVRYVQLDVGQALSGVLHAGGKTYVYDCGDTNSDLTEYLAFTGSRADGLFLSHPHQDHIGGLTELLDAGIRIGTLYVPANATAFGAESGYEALLERVRLTGTEIVEVAAGDELVLGGLNATVVAPSREVLRGSDPNDRSIVLLIEIGEHALLLCGDADGSAEPLGVDCDVLQVAHHASANAAGTAFLRDATPDIALISVGRNSYGHPNAATLARLEDAGADIYLTQDSGALTLYFGNSIRVEAYCP